MRKIIIVSMLVLLLVNCSNKEVITTISESDAPQQFLLADSVASLLVNKLVGRLTESIQKNGLIDAIDVCHKEAYKITDKLVDSFEDVKSMKRVSTKYRNPGNKPDTYDLEALLWFENNMSENVMPKSYAQKVVKKNKETIRYYKPIIIQTKCLLCHGDDEARLPEVAKRISEHYPDDTAINYNIGDFRGAIRVEVEGNLL